MGRGGGRGPERDRFPSVSGTGWLASVMTSPYDKRRASMQAVSGTWACNECALASPSQLAGSLPMSCPWPWKLVQYNPIAAHRLAQLNEASSDPRGRNTQVEPNRAGLPARHRLSVHNSSVQRGERGRAVAAGLTSPPQLPLPAAACPALPRSCSGTASWHLMFTLQPEHPP